MRITLLLGVHQTPDRGSVVDMPAGEFLDDLGLPEGSASLECTTREQKLAGPGFVLAQYRAGARDKFIASLDPTSATDILCYDIDTQSRAEIDAAWPTWARFDAAVYSTMKHTPAEPRIRLLVRLSRPVANASGDEYVKLYHAVAHLLNIAFDASTKDRARFFFGPQHRPGTNGDAWRFRFRGAALPVDAVLAALASGEIPPAGVGAGTGAVVVASGGPLRLPPVGQLRTIAAKLLRSSVPSAVATGAVLEATLEGRAYAESGSIHLAGRDMAFALVRDVPLFDGEGFADKYLRTSWAEMPGAGDDERLRNWQAQVESASAKIADERATQAAASARFAPAVATELSDEDKAAAGALEGALVNEHRGNYYVWDARGRRYVGPIKGTGLSAACRDGLAGVPNFTFVTFGKNGSPSLKSGPTLVTEYGYRLESVNYWAVPPAAVFNEEAKAIHVPAYHWNKWEPREHLIATELLAAIGGEQVARLYAWLFKFTDLRQPLPALVLVGPRGVWKSRLAQILARFWSTRESGNPCAATQVLGRFSRPILSNPVIHTDEVMAKSESGRAIPEIYRESIMSTVHMVEAKGVDPVTLHTATRHIISVNDLDQVFGGGEVDAASVEATVERYLVVDIEGERMAAFESRWEGTAEMEALREGSPLLEHVTWMEGAFAFESTCRLFVDTGTDADVLLRARFADDVLVMCMAIAVEALLAEPQHTHVGQLHRLPLVVDENGQMRLAPGRIVEQWADSKLTAGSGLKKPSAQKVGRLLQKAGIKHFADERACDSKTWKAWSVNHERLREYLRVEGSHTWDEVEIACEKVFGVRISW